jgi:hypothetical protein
VTSTLWTWFLNSLSLMSLEVQLGTIILNINGLGGKGETSEYATAYAASKAAVTSLTKSIARKAKNARYLPFRLDPWHGEDRLLPGHEGQPPSVLSATRGCSVYRMLWHCLPPLWASR